MLPARSLPGSYQLDPVAVRVAHEAEERAALADPIRLPLRLDSLLLQPGERRVEIVHRERDVPVPRAEIVGAPVVVQRELELLGLARDPEEVVRCLPLAVA